MTSRTRTQTIAMIEAMRSHLGGVALEIGALCRIGTADAALLRRTLAPAADPAGLLAWAGWQQVHEGAQILIRPDPAAVHCIFQSKPTTPNDPNRPVRDFPSILPA